MPQLDPNTFIYQYIGIIAVFIAVYSMLSYVFLPVLLRATLIRNLFLTTRQTISETLLVISAPFQNSLGLKHVIFFPSIVTAFATFFATQFTN
jgi:hypothetical protein